jgi:hypothetical protein
MFKVKEIETKPIVEKEVLHMAIEAMVEAIDTVSYKLLKLDYEGNINTVSTFVERVLSFDTFYTFMPTRILELIDEVHEDVKYRDYVLEMAEKMIFHLYLHGEKMAYANLTKAICLTAYTTKDHDTLCPDNFKSTVKLADDFEESSLLSNPILVLFYMASMYYNRSVILTEELKP